MPHSIPTRRSFLLALVAAAVPQGADARLGRAVVVEEEGNSEKPTTAQAAALQRDADATTLGEDAGADNKQRKPWRYFQGDETFFDRPDAAKTQGAFDPSQTAIYLSENALVLEV